jgi:hypothetical protein
MTISETKLNTTSTYTEIESETANIKKINVPFIMMLSYFKIERKAILIETTVDATVIAIDNYRVSSDSTMILPITDLSDAYIISTIEYSNQKFKAIQFAIVALNNLTNIRILFQIEPNLPLTIDGIEYQNGSEMVLQLNELQTYQINHKADLSGTLVNASATVAVFSGNRCQKIALKNSTKSGACSHLVEQLPPIDRLDNTYIAPPNMNRYGAILKIVSPFRNKVTYSVGSNKTTVPLHPQGYIQFSVDENEVVFIESERPVLVTSFAAGSDTSGDPYMINIPGINQYLNEYNVVTPSNFTNNYITLMIEETSLAHLKINGRGLIEYARSFHAHMTVGTVRYIVTVVHVSDVVINVKTTNNAVFGLLVYGHRKNDGHGFAGNIVLPDVCFQ